MHYGDTALTKLRAMVTVVDHEITQITPTSPLHTAWAELVTLLALGDAPETRDCPVCNGVGMRGARRCGHCWATLEPLAAVPAVAQGAAS